MSHLNNDAQHKPRIINTMQRFLLKVLSLGPLKAETPVAGEQPSLGGVHLPASTHKGMRLQLLGGSWGASPPLLVSERSGLWHKPLNLTSYPPPLPLPLLAAATTGLGRAGLRAILLGRSFSPHPSSKFMWNTVSQGIHSCPTPPLGPQEHSLPSITQE